MYIKRFNRLIQKSGKQCMESFKKNIRQLYLTDENLDFYHAKFSKKGRYISKSFGIVYSALKVAYQ